ncbi:MAG: hypothetical protein LQ349_008137 [Xanthoria aureola]|nr:MAG: hypothetical protein LQ349_008137 [Xanthoria aureola]
MILIHLSCLAMVLPFAGAATLSVRQSGLDVDSPTNDKSSSLEDRKLKRDIFDVPGQNPVSPVTVQCNAMLGAGLEARSCFDALSFAPYGVHQETWLPAITPLAIPGNRLPVIIFSNDTTCAINLLLVPPYFIGHASAFNISEAARAVIKQCVIPRRVGGQATNIGGDNKVSVQIAGNGRNLAECGQPIRATPRSCGYILNEMRKDSGQEAFGRPGSPQLTVALPLTLRSPDGLCQMVLDSRIQATSIASSWTGVWLALEMIAAYCVRAGKGGRLAIPAKDAVTGAPSRALIVTIMDEPAQLVLPGGENDTDQRYTAGARDHSAR